MNRSIVLAIVLSLGAVTSGVAQEETSEYELPRELAMLERFVGNPAQMVESMRSFASLQREMVSWDRQLVAEYDDKGDGSLVAAKRSDMQRRFDLIELGWLFVLNFYPEDAAANNYYGEYVYDYTNNKNEAISLWKRSLGIDEDFAPAHNNLSVHFLHTGNVSAGLRHIETAVELEPKNPDYLFNITQAYLNYFPRVETEQKISREKVYSRAMAYSKDAARYAPDDYEIVQDYAVNFFAAQNFDVTPDWEDAAAAWVAARALARNTGDRYYTFLNEARVWRLAGQYERSISPLENAAALLPNETLPRDLLEDSRARMAASDNG